MKLTRDQDATAARREGGPEDEAKPGDLDAQKRTIRFVYFWVGVKLTPCVAEGCPYGQPFFLASACSFEKEGGIPMKKMLIRMLALVLALSMNLGLAQAATDMAGREVTLQEPARRVVVLTASDVEILYALGAGDTLAGRGEYANYPLAALDVPSVQSGMETNIEQIIALEPDLVIMAVMAQTPEQVERLEKAGIAVAVTNATDIAGTYEAITLIGSLVGRSDEAAALVKDMQARFDSLREKAASLEGGSVYFEVSPLMYGLWTAGKGTFMQEIADIVGLKNVFEDVNGWAEVSQEQVLARDPDFIVTVAMYFGEGPTPAEEISSRAGWENLQAVKNLRVLQLDSDEVSRPGPRLANAAELLFDLVHTSSQTAKTTE